MLKKGVSYDAVMMTLSLLVPLCMFLAVSNESNLYMDGETPWLVLFVSILCIAAIKLNQRLMNPLLDVFILIYLIFWHLRFLTLSLFPQYELVLTRTVLITSDIYNDYILLVAVAFSATVLGFALAYYAMKKLLSSKDKRLTVGVSYSDLRLYLVMGYFLVTLLYQVYISSFGIQTLPTLVSYLSIFFRLDLASILLVFLLFSNGIGRKNWYFVFGAVVIYVLFTVMVGSRSGLVNLVVSVLMLMLLLQRKPNYNLKALLWVLLLITLMFLSFLYSTFQRDLRQVETSGFSLITVKYSGCKLSEVVYGGAIDSCQELYVGIFGVKGDGDAEYGVRDAMVALKSSLAGMFGYALARAGYLDFSLEMYANSDYKREVSVVNVVKSIIDNSVPGKVFEDGERIEHRIRSVYNPKAVGYQSDALGIVGENYLLFGSYSFVAIAIVAFIFGFTFYLCGSSVLGLYFKFTVATGVLMWWNSFGYDTLVIELTRKLLVGVVIISITFYWPQIYIWLGRVSGKKTVDFSK